MNRGRLWRIFQDAHGYMRKERPDDLRWAQGISIATYRRLK
jgi:hypothetical protein